MYIFGLCVVFQSSFKHIELNLTNLNKLTEQLLIVYKEKWA